MRKAKNLRYAWICAISLIMLLILSCASVKDAPRQYGVNVKKLNANEIQSISNWPINPYIEPGSIIRGKIDEFVVIRIEFKIEREMLISIFGDLKDNDGKYIPIYYSEEFLTYWDQFKGSNDRNSTQNFIKKQNLIKQTCIPGSQFKLRPGQYIYYLVFIGPYPIKKPARGRIDISTSFGEYDSILIDIE